MSDNIKKTHAIKVKTFQGVVISNKMNKSAVIQISYRKKHSLFKKFITKTKKVIIHDEKNECSIGDSVEFKESRPISKNKSFQLLKIINKIKEVSV